MSNIPIPNHRLKELLIKISIIIKSIVSTQYNPYTPPLIVLSVTTNNNNNLNLSRLVLFSFFMEALTSLNNFLIQLDLNNLYTIITLNLDTTK